MAPSLHAMPSIALSMIVLDVEDIIGMALKTVVPHVDEIVIVDTGSADKTRQAILDVAPSATILDFHPDRHPEAFAIDSESTWISDGIPGPYSDKHMLCDFSAARQFGWNRCKSDFIFWMDSDDILIGGENLREIVRQMEQGPQPLDTAIFTYEYAHNPDGRPICTLVRERIARKSAKWHQPIHEVIANIGRGQFFEQVIVKHQRAEYELQPRVHHRNLKVLTRWSKHRRPEEDPRMLFYLGMEERFLWPDRAIKTFEKYCKLSGWDEERAVAHYLCGSMHEDFGRIHDAYREYAQAALEIDFNPDPYFGAARLAYYKRDWLKCIEYTDRGIAIRDAHHKRRSTLMHNPLERVCRPLIYLSAALVATGQWERALDVCNEGLKHLPEDPYLLGNKQIAEEKKKGPPAMNEPFSIRENEDLSAPPTKMPNGVLAAFAIQMWKRLKSDPVRAMGFLQTLPKEIENEPIIKKAFDQTASMLDTHAGQKTEPKSRVEVSDNKLQISLWTGPAYERWSPKTLDETGLGGSETAAVCLARELGKRGHRVTLYADCDESQERLERSDDEPYLFARYQRSVVLGDPAPESDILVVSRQANALNILRGYKKAYIWAHDIHTGEKTECNKIFESVEGIFCLSRWHKHFFAEFYDQRPADKIIVTRNGIDPQYFQREPGQKENRLIYSSSPDRGLLRLLELLPAIERQVPDVVLDVCYGFHNWDESARIRNDPQELAHIRNLKEMIARFEASGRVKMHGRLSKQALADVMYGCKVWAYPTWFTETSCITAMECQASGAVPVSSYLAALPETVTHGFLLRGENTSPEYGDSFVKRVVSLLQDDELQRTYAQGGRAYTLKNCSWSSVAKEWEQIFLRALEDKKPSKISLPPITE